MRRLPAILLLTGVTLIVIVALLVSGLRLALPHLNSWRPAVLKHISQVSGLPVTASQLNAHWETFGPTLDARDLHIGLSDGGYVGVKRIMLALDVWQSLLHARWQFRDLTFYQLHLSTNTPITQSANDKTLESNRVSDLFLRQFDHFDLRDSRISFLTPSGQRAELAIPQLTWLNDSQRHRAEGQVSLSSLTGQHGIMQVRMDLRDDNGLLNNGTVWMQADEVDVKPWLNTWTQENIELSRATFSLAAWITLRRGEVASGDVWLKQGGASWPDGAKTHQLSVDNLTAHMMKVNGGWQLDIPATRIAIDNKPWPDGSLTLAWFPEQYAGGPDGKRSDELRVRANNIALSGLDGLLPLARRVSPKLEDVWHIMRPDGTLDALALDIPLKAADKTRFQGRWSNLSWQQWKLLPGAEHVSGSIAGSVEHATLTAKIQDAMMPYQGVFPAPLEIAQGVANLTWRKDARGWQLDGNDIDVTAKAVRARGDFRYLQPADGDPWLGILAGISTHDGGQAWRYFPENLMSKGLVSYLSGAIKGGTAQDATLVTAGNPHHFPYEHNEGQFQVTVPLRKATFAFQPTWPALQDFDINLDFINDGLWMQAPEVTLGGVKGYNVSAVIPHYKAEKLLIDADVKGPGEAVGPYFNQTPLKPSLGAALEELQVSNEVNARLHLDIPLDGELTTASGDVVLNNNRLYIKPIDSTLENLTGRFHFANGDLDSGPLQARWFTQPLNLSFTTRELQQNFQVGVKLDGNWQPTKTGLLPAVLNKRVSGSVPWRGDVAITLPFHSGATYEVGVTADLKNVSSHLPSPIDKKAGQPLPLKIAAKGNMQGFTLSGSAAETQRFNSRWLTSGKLALDRAIWVSDGRTVPPLPREPGIELNLPPLDGAEWLALFNQGAASGLDSGTRLPQRITLLTPALMLGGQTWHNISIGTVPKAGGTKIVAQGREINAVLLERNSGAWRANIDYLYFNPASAAPTADSGTADASLFSAGKRIDFSDWPDLQLRCAECWLYGQKYGRVDGDFTIHCNTLKLTNGLIDTGFARLSADGEWVNSTAAPRTSLKGKLHGQTLEAAAEFFGLSTPLKAANFDVDYDLHWRAAPWQPDIPSLNGILRARLGKGEIADVDTGHAGQILRLLSVDALMRKLRLDFSDTFGDGFYYDSVRSVAWIKDGVMHTDDTFIDGLEADIAMKGKVDLVHRELDVEALVAPEISATVGVAAAFAVNPIVGAAVFAASRVLGPLWSKVSILRYRITGPVAKPQINEVMRAPREDKTQ